VVAGQLSRCVDIEAGLEVRLALTPPCGTGTKTEGHGAQWAARQTLCEHPKTPCTKPSTRRSHDGGMNTPVPPSALLVLDVFCTFDFPGGAALYEQTLGIVDNLRHLCRRFRDAGRPVIFVNDNFGHWEDTFNDVVTRAGKSGGGLVANALHPEPSDYRLLKPRHSAFFETSLPSLLAHLGIEQIVVTGIAADSCVLSTVMDAHVRGFETLVPRDTTASQSPARTARVLDHLKESCGIATPAADDLSVSRTPAPSGPS